MAKAIWNDKIIAESDDTIIVEGNHYFPRDAVNAEFIVDSAKNTVCPWKGVASYYSIVVDGSENRDAAWYYPNPSDAADSIKDYIAFWHGVQIIP